MDGTQRQVVVDDRRSLVYLAQQACITPHTWLCTAKDLEKPDQLIFDLDPSDDDLAKVRRATRLVGELLDDLGLTSYLKTTGSRGYHVLVPLRPSLRLRRGARRSPGGAREVLVEKEPDLLTLEQRKAKRGDRVYVDIVPQRLRPDRGAGVRRPGAARRAGLHADHVGRALAGEAGPVHGHVRATETRPT